MLANNYEIYVTSNIALVRSICVKSQQTIEAINSYLQMLGIDMRSVPPHLWKYYVNLKGEYWTASMVSTVYSQITLGDDVMMTFTPTETNVPVEFTKANLQLYPLSLNEFRRFDHYYQDMVKRYPEQEWLIRRIIDPIEWIENSIYFTPVESGPPVQLTKANLSMYPKTRAELLLYDSYYNALLVANPGMKNYIDRIIDSGDYSPIPNDDGVYTIDDLLDFRDGTILFHDKNLIESNEVTLLQDIQQWMYSFTDRWNVSAFQNSDRLYPAAWLAVMKIHCVPAIINMRLERIKSNEAHSFHIWTYLAGYFRLDQFKDALKTDQALFLYRNIDRIVKTAGTKETLLFIYENMIKNHGMTLNTFEIRQDNSNFATTRKKDIIINKFPIDATNIVEYFDDVVNVEDFIEMLRNQAVLNPDRLAEDVENLLLKASRTSSPNVATGVIECDRSRQAADGLVSGTDERFTQWLYLALNGKLNHQFSITVFDDKEVVINALQAIYLLWYCTDRYTKYRAHFYPNDPLHNNGTSVVELTSITDPLPTISVTNILKNPNKIYDDFIADGFIQSRFISPELVNQVMNLDITNFELVNIPVFNNVADFHAFVDTVIKKKITLRNIVNDITDIYGKTQMDQLVTCEYLDLHQSYPPTLSANWKEFFTSIDLDIENVPLESLILISREIVKEFVGNIEVREGLPSPYYEMMQILRILSSYMVTYVPSDSSGIPKPIQWPSLHVKLKSFSMGYKYYIDAAPEFSFSYTVTP